MKPPEPRSPEKSLSEQVSFLSRVPGCSVVLTILGCCEEGVKDIFLTEFLRPNLGLEGGKPRPKSGFLRWSWSDLLDLVSARLPLCPAGTPSVVHNLL